jgi:hypothetical protein
MENFTLAELGVFCGVLGGVLTSLILTFQKSKCETINCCGVKCKRKVKDPPDGADAAGAGAAGAGAAGAGGGEGEGLQGGA